MERILLSAFPFLLASGLMAQAWCPPGATWTEEWDGWGVDYRVEYRYVGDTFFEGRWANKTTVTTEGIFIGGQPVSTTHTEYTAYEDGVVWLWGSAYDQPAGWDTLYWFDAQVGARWYPVGHPEDCPPYGMLEVVETGEIELDGVLLRTLNVMLIDQDGNPLGGFENRITERLGMVPRYPFIEICGSVTDYFFPHFVCYSDAGIQRPEDSGECHLTMGIGGPFDGTGGAIIQPNPGTDHFELLTAPGTHTVTLYDITGRVLWERETTTERTRFNTSDLPAGLYLIRPGTHVSPIRWVKQ